MNFMERTYYLKITAVFCKSPAPGGPAIIQCLSMRVKKNVTHVIKKDKKPDYPMHLSMESK